MALPGCIALYALLPFSDSCGDAGNWLTIAFSTLAFILVVLIYTGISLWRSQKPGKNFDGIPLFLFLAFGLVVFLHFSSKSSKFWTSELGTVKTHGSYLSFELTFYANGSFRMAEIAEHFRCAYYGDYTVANDTISLDRPDIAYLSENNFSQKYQIQDSILVPILDSFPVLSFHKGSLSQLIAE